MEHEYLVSGGGDGVQAGYSLYLGHSGLEGAVKSYGGLEWGSILGSGGDISSIPIRAGGLSFDFQVPH